MTVILIIAAALRGALLADFPNGFTGDEAQQGYSAYSILNSGKDEWGQVLPVFPRGFGDFKPPLYTYLTVPFVAVFGLNINAVRLPAAVLGILTVLVTYLLTKQLFGEKVALWSSFLLSINPWHVQLSRTAFEGNVGILFFGLGLLFFLKAKEKKLWLLLSFISFGATLYSYHPFRVFTILFIITLFLLNFKKFFIQKYFLVFLIFLLPILFNLPRVLSRVSDISIMSPKVVTSYFQNKQSTPLPPFADRIFDNKAFFVGGLLLENYLSYFNPQFFFSSSRPDNNYLNFPYFPLLFPVELILWILAGYIIFYKKDKNGIFLIVWFLLAPIAASLSTGASSANRTVTFLPLTAIISGLGGAFLAERLKKVSPAVALILIFNLLIFLHFYFIKLPQKSPENLRFGYEQTFNKIIELQDQFDQIVISRVFTQPQIFIGFYGRIDPNFYQQASVDWLRYEKAGKMYIDQLPSWNLGKYYFEDLDWKKKDSTRINALVVGEAKDFPKDVESVLDIKNPKGEVVYRLISTKNEK